MPDFGIFRGFNEKLFGDKLVAGQLPTQLGLIGSESVSPFLLNDYPNAAAAYSLRKLRKEYTGDAIEVRRASDNTTQDIGFVDVELDTTSLESFCSGTNGFVTTWYDQSGNSRDASQSTASDQPQIVSSGSVILENGKPSLQFDGVNYYMSYSGEILNQGSFVGFCVVKNNRTSGTGRIFDQSRTNGGAILTNGNGDNAEVFGHTSGGTRVLTDNQSYTTQVLQVGQILSGNSKLRINAVDKVTDTTTFTMSGNTGIDFVIGENSPPNNQLLNANLQEIVIYTTNNNSNITNIETNINDFYSIYS